MDANVTGYADHVDDVSQTYWYRVLAFNEAGPSGYSNVASTADQHAASPNDAVCDTLHLCCADDLACDSSWYGCPEEDADCAQCGSNDGTCIELCLSQDPDCPSRELICGAIGTCCAGDGCCDVQCPLFDPDPDCSNDQFCAAVGLCCDADGICHAFCNQTDADCGPADGGNGGGTGNGGGAGDGGGSGCGTIRYASDIHSEIVHVVTSNVDETLGFLGQTDRITVCESQTVQVQDAAGAPVGTLLIPFDLIDVAPQETPLVFISYQAGFGLSARIEYLTLDAVYLTP